MNVRRDEEARATGSGEALRREFRQEFDRAAREGRPIFNLETRAVTERRCREAEGLARFMLREHAFTFNATWSDQEGFLNDPPVFTGGWMIVLPAVERLISEGRVDRNAPLPAVLARHILCRNPRQFEVGVQLDQDGDGFADGSFGTYPRDARGWHDPSLREPARPAR